MRILYAAIDQAVPAAHGGSVHVTAVAEGLTSLGHDVLACVSPGDDGRVPAGGTVTWSALPPPFGSRRLRLLRAGALFRAGRAFGADAVIERYYNFGGEGILAARRLGALKVLEVNAPVVDYPGSPKAKIDRLMLVEPLRRWRDWLCAQADLIVAPSISMLPPHVPADRVLETEWGADTARFHPEATGPLPFQRRSGDIIAVFAGAFRPWHGAIDLVGAIKELRRRGSADFKGVLIGGGSEFAAVRQAAEGVDGVTLTGPLPHERIAACLAAADIGVAPFDLAAHPVLAHEFHWSPLKVFEYMACGLPVVVPRIERLAEIVRDGREGVVYEGSGPIALASALERLTDRSLRTRLGSAARARAVEHFSWRHHCQALDRALRAAHDASSHRH
jgi:glycosyltransferase involved in cell wall biosynthesis